MLLEPDFLAQRQAEAEMRAGDALLTTLGKGHEAAKAIQGLLGQLPSRDTLRVPREEAKALLAAYGLAMQLLNTSAQRADQAVAQAVVQEALNHGILP